MYLLRPVLLLAACLAVLPALAGPTLEEAVAGDWRSEAARARDVHRHPLQTLQFFGVAADQTVVEVWPGTGWYLEILAPFLADAGVYYAAGMGTGEGEGARYRNRMQQQLIDKVASDPARFGKARVTALMPPDATEPVPPGSADVVLTFRNVHNWLAAGNAEAMFAAFHHALKPGGTLGVVEHRAAPGTSLEQMKESGYVTEALVIELAAQAGFELAERSEVNANPKDTKDHPRGVWTLPPTLALKDQDREKYLAIGESDRMTLKSRRR
jgi:predicted methyltransferase